MPVFHTVNPTFQIWQMTESLSELMSMLPEGTKAPGYKAESRQMEWASVHVLIRRITGSFMWVEHRESGAPYLPGISEHISISHTRAYAAMCISPEPVGIDVERLSPRANQLRDRFMNAEEGFLKDDSLDSIKRSSDWKEKEATLIWSLKEAVFKILPCQDGVDFREHILSSPVSYASSGIILAQEKRTPDQLRYEVHYQFFPEFVLTWARAVSQ